MRRHVIADETGVRVCFERCDTCIFHAGNRMHLQPGRVKDMLEQVREHDSCIPCHKTLDRPKQAVCRGQFDALKTAPLQIAERLGLIVWIDSVGDIIDAAHERETEDVSGPSPAAGGSTRTTDERST